MKTDKIFINLLILQFLLINILSAEKIETFYGPVEVEEPVLLELIHSSAFQRLKFVRQYGVVYYTDFPEEYTRFDHSLGVFYLLRIKGACLKEQIAGLLHDVSHTAFSHVGDWIFDKIGEEKDYQNSIHVHFLEQSGLSLILCKHGFNPDEMQPLENLYPMLEKKGPDLCADRIEYNIQGAYHQGRISYEEALLLIDHIAYVEGEWISSNIPLMKTLVDFSLDMTENCWGGVDNYLSSKWLAESLLRAIDLKILSYEDIHFGSDEKIWATLLASDDAIIQELFIKIRDTKNHYKLVPENEGDIVIRSKFRGINPWVILEGKKVRLLDTDPLLKMKFTEVKERVHKGWAVQLLGKGASSAMPPGAPRSDFLTKSSLHSQGALDKEPIAPLCIAF